MAGFNNQLQDVWHSAHLARAVGSALVAPHFGESITWGRRSFARAFPFSDYFNLSAFAAAVPAGVVPPARFLAVCGRPSTPIVDVTLVGARPSKTENVEYDRVLGLRAAPAARVAVASPAALAAGGALLPRCVRVHRSVAYALDALAYPPAAGDPPFHPVVLRSATARALRAATTPTNAIWAAAAAALADVGAGRAVVAVHVRGGDFSALCSAAAAAVRWTRCLPSSPAMLRDAVRVARRHACGAVLVLAAPALLNVTVAEWRRHPAVLAANLTIAPLPLWVAPAGRPDLRGVTEQAAASMAAAFVGNAYSSWTRSVFEMRAVVAPGAPRPCSAFYVWGMEHPMCLDGDPTAPGAAPIVAARWRV